MVEPDPRIVDRFMAWLERERPQWLAAVPHASALAAEAWCLAREQPEGLVWLRMESAVRDAYRASRARKRGPPPASLQSDPEGPAEASGLLARDEVEALVRSHGTSKEEAEAFAAWLSGEPLDASAKRLGLHRSGVAGRRRRARERIGLSVEEVQALVGRIRGVPLEDAAWGAWRPARGSAVGTRGSRAWRARRGSKPVDPSTVSLRIKSALAKIRGSSSVPS